MEDAKSITVEVAYARPDEQIILKVQLPVGATIEKAIEQSGMLTRYPELGTRQGKVGIFGKLKPVSHMLREGDRVEIYRPLIADPKEVRKLRAAAGKPMKKGKGG